MVEVERLFFECFNIKPRGNICSLECCNHQPEYECKTCEYLKPRYPSITDSIYLELICIVNSRRILPGYDLLKMKEYILVELCTMLITESDKDKIRKLFKKDIL